MTRIASRFSRIPVGGLALLAVGLLLGAPAAHAEGPLPVEARPIVDADDVVAEAIATFDDDYKARGLSGDDKTSQRDWAMSKLAEFQHRDVVDRLAKVGRSRDPILKLLAVVYLGEQRALPGYAGEKILRIVGRDTKDEVLVMSALQSLGQLRYLGAREFIEDILGGSSFVLRKYAIAAVGEMRDVRLMEDVLEIAGIDVAGDKQAGAVSAGDAEGGEGAEQGGSSGEPEVVEEGYSYEGVDVTYDTGTAGDGDQKEAERIGKEQLEKNKREAEAAAGRSGSGGMGSAGPATGGGAGAGVSMGSGGGRGGSSRSNQEFLPAILRTMHQLTGEKFDNSRQIHVFVRRNAAALEANEESLQKAERLQRQEARGR